MSAVDDTVALFCDVLDDAADEYGLGTVVGWFLGWQLEREERELVEE